MKFEWIDAKKKNFKFFPCQKATKIMGFDGIMLIFMLLSPKMWGKLVENYFKSIWSCIFHAQKVISMTFNIVQTCKPFYG